MKRVLLLLFVATACEGPPSYVQVTSSELEPYDELLATHEPFSSPGGLVGDAETAARIAEAVLESVYDPESIQMQRPLRVGIRDSIWVVRGTLPDDYLGGVAHVEISRSDGRILRVSHGH